MVHRRPPASGHRLVDGHLAHGTSLGCLCQSTIDVNPIAKRKRSGAAGRRPLLLLMTAPISRVQAQTTILSMQAPSWFIRWCPRRLNSRRIVAVIRSLGFGDSLGILQARRRARYPHSGGGGVRLRCAAAGLDPVARFPRGHSASHGGCFECCCWSSHWFLSSWWFNNP